MADTVRANDEPVKDTQESAMPTEEQQTTEALPDKPEVEVLEDKVLPDEAKERTKREFDKLREQLREERARREYMETVFNTIQTPKADKVESPPLYDRETGMLNEQVLTDVQQRALQAEERAKQAEASIVRYMDEVERREAYAKHPELNPAAESFDEEFSELTSAFILRSMTDPEKYGGKQLSFVDAATRAKKILARGGEVAKAEGAKEALEKLAPKEQAALEAAGSSGRRSDTTNLDELKVRTRKGDMNAITERLSRLKS